jgi:hypothetical protein
LGQVLQARNDQAGALEQFTACLELKVDETASDTQLTTPALVGKECTAEAGKIREHASR